MSLLNDDASRRLFKPFQVVASLEKHSRNDELSKKMSLQTFPTDDFPEFLNFSAV